MVFLENVYEQGLLLHLDLTPAAVKGFGLAASVITLVCMGCILFYEFRKWGVF